MADETKQDVKAGTAAKALSRSELLENLRRLQERLQSVRLDKKSSTADYNDQIKDLDKEITDTLATLKNAPVEEAKKS